MWVKGLQNVGELCVTSTHREEVGVKVQQSHEHEHQQNSTAQLHVLLRRALSHRGDSGKHALSFRTRLGQQQEKTTSEGKVSGGGERGRLFLDSACQT